MEAIKNEDIERVKSILKNSTEDNRILKLNEKEKKWKISTFNSYL